MSSGGRAWHWFRKRWVPMLWLGALTVLECLVFQWLLFRDQPEYEFSLASVSGVLSGAPAFKSWQQRFLGPWVVRGFEFVVGEPLRAFEAYTSLGLLLSNALLYSLLRRKAVSEALSVLGVTCWVVARVAYAYRLEYSWDAIDVLVFSVFGFWVSRGGGLLALAPLLVIGVLNHETALYLPLWYVLSVFSAPPGGHRAWAGRLRAAAGAAVALALMGSAIGWLRERYYLGPPLLPAGARAASSPIGGNEFHLTHNLRQLVVDDWRAGRVRIAASIWLALVLLVRELVGRGRHALAALWSLSIFATITCFGYVNETRLYLPLAAFWFAYAWPPKWLEQLLARKFPATS